MYLKSKQAFRKENQILILSVRITLLLCVPMLYLLFPNVDTSPGDVYQTPESFHSRSILAVPVVENCTSASILEFPPDGLTRQQRQSGWIAIHSILACYSFILLAIVCDDYFVPAIEVLCHKLKMTEDVAGATFMAAASSSPELFINCIGTFVTEGDIGVGTIVGSAVFNILAVPACCGLLAGQVIHLDWWAVSRDSLMYGIAVIALIFTLQDEKVQWYEAAILVTAYTMYILEIHGLMDSTNKIDVENCKDSEPAEENELEASTNIWKWPSEEVSCGKKLFWTATWPISFLLWISVPDCRKYKNLYFITFGMCVIWIGATSYFVAWLITAVGDTLNIPDSVMGLTFLAAGTSVPEAVSAIIVTNQGHGSMGISSSIGSNTFDILLCLGLPWLIKSLFYPTVPGENWVNIKSHGLTYSALSLLSTLFGLYISFVCNKFVLDWKIGLTCTLMYIAFLALASLIELNVFFQVNLPTCLH